MNNSLIVKFIFLISAHYKKVNLVYLLVLGTVEEGKSFPIKVLWIHDLGTFLREYILLLLFMMWTLFFDCIREVSITYSLAAWFTHIIDSLKSSLLFLLLECSLNWTWSVRYANIFIQNFILYLASNTSCRSESSYFAWSFGQQMSRMIFIMLQYDRF